MHLLQGSRIKPNLIIETAPGGQGQRSLSEIVSTWALPLLLALTIGIAALTTSGFLTFDNLRGILINTSVVGIAAVALTPVTLSGNLVSLGLSQQAMLSSVMFIALLGTGTPLLLAAAITIVALALVGFGQGLFISLGLNPMITTLAAGAIIFGFATLATRGVVVTAPKADFAWIALSSALGLPLPIYLFAGFTILVTVLLGNTALGRNMLLVGANRETARLSGLSQRSATVAAFAIFGIGTAIAGIIVAAQSGQATTQDLAPLTGDVIAALLVGGTAIQGGYGSAIRSAFGALMITIFTNAMVLHNVDYGWRLASVGALVILMVSLLHTLRKKTS